jgi:glycosyltransferase involved in cell wall biosynthesis
MLTRARARRRVAVVQPYLPAYRTRFFELVESRLDADGVDVHVLYGRPPAVQAARGDASTCHCASEVPTRRIVLPGGRSFTWHSLHGKLARADAVIFEQALQNVEVYPALLKQMISGRVRDGRKVAFWGHGRTYTKPVSRIEGAAKKVLTRQGSWFFVYTHGGAQYLARHGFPRDRITVVRNSIDTTALAEARRSAEVPRTPEHCEAMSLRRRYGLVPRRTALFLGGLDAPKRIPFLLDAARLIARELPGFRLLVAGEGADRPLVEKAVAPPGSPVVALGRADRQRAAVLGAVSDVMLMPGRVGLCAVDSFALRTPVITTDWPWHAPEFEYLTHGRNALVTHDDPASYARTVTELLRDTPRLESMQAACAGDSSEYTIQGMASRFCEGVLQMLGSDRG